VNGIAFGGGLEIVLNCDLVLASEKARFGFVETKNGLVATQGGKVTQVVKHRDIGLTSVF
jgi:enoyl-CoA hydratase/carnithine racemase